MLIPSVDTCPWPVLDSPREPGRKERAGTPKLANLPGHSHGREGDINALESYDDTG